MHAVRTLSLVFVLFLGLASVVGAQSPEATPRIALSPLIAGTAFDVIPQGEPGTLSIVVAGILDPRYGAIAVVLKNNTGDDVYGARVMATARDESGVVVAESIEFRVQPTKIIPGGIALATIHFRGVEFDGEPAFEIAIDHDDHQMWYELFPGLSIERITQRGDRIVGEAANKLNTPVRVSAIQVLCFEEDGTPLSSAVEAESSEIAPGETIAFRVNTRGACEKYLAVFG